MSASVFLITGNATDGGGALALGHARITGSGYGQQWHAHVPEANGCLDKEGNASLVVLANPPVAA